MSPLNRYNFVKNHNLCRNCLNHSNKSQCQNTRTCKHCGKNHHSLLHRDLVSNLANDRNEEVKSNDCEENKDSAKSNDVNKNCESDRMNTTKAIDNNNSKSDSKRGVYSCRSPDNQVLLGTINAYAIDKFNQVHSVRILLDQCSQLNLITQNCAKKLSLDNDLSNGKIMGVGGIFTRSLGETDVVIQSQHYGGYKLNVHAQIVKSVSDPLPNVKLPDEIYNNVKELHLADRKFYVPDRIDMLLGLDSFCEIVVEEGQTFVRGKPSRLNTKFGWVIMGTLPSHFDDFNRTVFFISNPPLEETLLKFWTEEQIPKKVYRSAEDSYVEEFYEKTCKRDENGRYSVSFPMKANCEPIGDNRQQAARSLAHLEKRLSKNDNAFNQYHAFMKEMIDLDHMNIAEKPSNYVLPHLCVFKDNSSTTKCRVVFNASAPDSKGISLNQRMLPGPPLQKNINNILFMFRLNEVALCTDIKMCYRQILVNEPDRQYQHVFYKSPETDEVKEYEVKRLLYGLTPSAYLCQKTLLKLVDDEGKDFPLAAKAVKSCSFVDDIICGAKNETEAIKLREELITLMKRGGFELRKWSSSHQNVLADLEPDKIEMAKNSFGDTDTIKILGLLWDPKSDCFVYAFKKFEGQPSKRSILSYLARIYDPMQFIAPITFYIKFFVQQCHVLKLGWDDYIPDEFAKEWLHFTESLTVIENLRIPRYIVDLNDQVNLVVFCDASERGYACVAYLHQENMYESRADMIMSRTRLAPIKPVSVAKLELNACRLAAEVVESILAMDEMDFHNIVMFSDSQIALNWIKAEACLFETFVAHRIEKIQLLTSMAVWRYIPSELNPADQASRGIDPSKFVNYNPLWFHGPSFMQDKIEQWPEFKFKPIDMNKLPCLKKVKITLATFDPMDPPSHLYAIIKKYSSMEKLMKIFAIMMRFIRNCRARRLEKEKKTGLISAHEIQRALLVIIKVCQLEFFKEEFQLMEKNKPVKRFLQLNAFIDPNDGLIRVGGRLEKSSLPYDAKHPVILDKRFHITEIIVNDYHKRYMHVGPTWLKAFLRRKFWIINGNTFVRKVIKNCTTCLRFSGKQHQPMMSDLPEDRVTPSRPFAVTGVDYADPFNVKSSNLRRAPITKGYFAIFVCQSTRAVHIEFVSDLSTDAFMAALHRFVSRRGLPRIIRSDNGSNFVGASNQIKQIIEFLKQNDDYIHRSLASLSIQWIFNPPYAPNFGGTWEIQVKLIKKLLYSEIKERVLTYEEYATVLARIEAIINQRPLIEPTEDCDDIDYLTSVSF